jgi:hypothetical protein
MRFSFLNFAICPPINIVISSFFPDNSLTESARDVNIPFGEMIENIQNESGTNRRKMFPKKRIEARQHNIEKPASQVWIVRHEDRTFLKRRVNEDTEK